MEVMSARGLYAITSVILISLISLIGIAFISISEERMRRIDFFLVSLAAGSLFGDAFIHLLPESFAKPETRVEVSIYVLAGIFVFFILEKFLLWRHEHLLKSERTIQPVGYMNLFADGVHNLIDGMIIGAAYLVSPRVGIATTLAVISLEFGSVSEPSSVYPRLRARRKPAPSIANPLCHPSLCPIII